MHEIPGVSGLCLACEVANSVRLFRPIHFQDYPSSPVCPFHLDFDFLSKNIQSQSAGSDQGFVGGFAVGSMKVELTCIFVGWLL